MTAPHPSSHFAAVETMADRRECDPSYTLETHIASLHRDKTPEEVAELYRAWEASHVE